MNLSSTDQSPSNIEVVEALKRVYDPEIGINLIDLGVIYDIHFEGSTVRISMTLTTRGCPLHEMITEGVKASVLQVPGVQDCQVHLVWDPPWNPSMMSSFPS
jgi:metal-sulfur cluster biosynthetic enzyme